MPFPLIRRRGYIPRHKNPLDFSPMTILAARFTDNGVAIVADGRRRREDGTVFCDTAQKIHYAQHSDFIFVYGWVNGVSFDTVGCGKFDFAEETLVSVQEMAAERFATADDFVGRLANSLYSKVVGCLRGTYAGRPDSNDYLASLLIAGYFQGLPIEVTVGFPRANGFLTKPVCTHVAFPPTQGLVVLSGSAILLENEFFQKDVLVSNLIDAQILLEDFSRKCIAGNGVIPDCSTFGGHIHMAILTPAKFEWIIAPVRPLGVFVDTSEPL